MSFYAELKRRNVIRVGIAYSVAGWVIVEVSSVLLPTFDAPEWVMRALILILVAGMPIGLLVAWMFEITPDGIKKEDGRDDAEEVLFKARTARKADLAIIVTLSLIVVYFVTEKIWLSDLVRGNKLAIACRVAIHRYEPAAGSTILCRGFDCRTAEYALTSS